jgi:putative transposase
MKKQVKSRLTPDQIRRLIENFDKQGKGVRDFCETNGISEVTYYNWRKKYCPIPAVTPSRFIEIIPTFSSEESIKEKLFAQVREIYLYQPVSAEYLKSLLV